MKTTISINIGGLAFTIDDDAYQELHNYLDRLSAHFQKEEGGDDIMADIEARIAEEFARKREIGREVISIEMVREIITRMGRVEDLTGEKNNVTIEDPLFARNDNARTKGAKKLYRDPEHAMLAGVAGGLGAYFNIDPSIPRIIFVLLTLFGGSGIIIYIILWLVLPEADSPLKQSELHGESPTIKDIEKKVKDMVESGKKKFSEIDTTKAKESVKHTFHATVDTVSRTAGSIGSGIVKIIAIILGVAVILVGVSGIVGATIIGTLTLFGLSTTLWSLPVMTAYLGTPLVTILITSVWLVIIIPMGFIISLGAALTSQQRIKFGWGFGTLLLFWIIALSVAGTLIISAI